MFASLLTINHIDVILFLFFIMFITVKIVNSLWYIKIATSYKKPKHNLLEFSFGVNCMYISIIRMSAAANMRTRNAKSDIQKHCQSIGAFFISLPPFFFFPPVIIASSSPDDTELALLRSKTVTWLRYSTDSIIIFANFILITFR